MEQDNLRRTRMAVSTTPQLTPAEAAGQIQHSLAMEGLEMSAQAKAEMQEAVEGRLSADELVHRALARYGLI